MISNAPSTPTCVRSPAGRFAHCASAWTKWLAKYEQQAGESSPIAIILCSDKDADVVELMDLEQDNIHVAEYWLELPPKEVLQAKLHRAMIEARTRLELKRTGD